MADLYWPSGVGDDPLLQGLTWSPRENGEVAQTDSGLERGAPRFTGVDVEMTAGYPMSHWQFHMLWLPWWMGSPAQGGTLNGTLAFWLRDPYLRRPQLWRRLHGQAMKAERDGVGYIVWLSLLGLPS